MCCTDLGIAQLQSKNDAVHGNNSITADLDTGLEWLDLTKTKSKTYNDVVGSLGSGAEFDGFHIATSTELDGLFSSAGATAPFTVANAPQTNTHRVRAATDLLGVTSNLGFSYFAQGQYEDETLGSNVGSAYFQYSVTLIGGSIQPHFSRASIDPDVLNPGSNNSFGTWLYRYGDERNVGTGNEVTIDIGGGSTKAGGVSLWFPEVVQPGTVTSSTFDLTDLDDEVQNDFGTVEGLVDHSFWDINYSGNFTGDYTLELGVDQDRLAAAGLTTDQLKVVKRGVAGELTILEPIATTPDSITVQADSFSTFGFAVPEPSVGLLILYAAAAMAALHRRRRRC